MKISIISPNKNNLQEMARVLERLSHLVTIDEGGKSKMRVIAEREQPDVILIEGMCCDLEDLTQVEYVTLNFPRIAVILLCATHTPEFLLNSMRAGVREVLPSPAPSGLLEAAISRVAAKLSGTQSKPIGKVLAFMPCKGGSGATFLATNLGYQLAETKSVLLIDLNLQFGDALSFVHDHKPTSTLAHVAHDITRLDPSLLAASSVKITPTYSILAAPEDPAQAVEIKPEHIEEILDMAITQYDFVILDINRNLDTLSIRALDRADRIFPVLQAGLPHLRNANKLLHAFKSLSYPDEKIEMIINRFEKSGDIGLDGIRRSLGAISLHTVPNSYKEVNASITHGDPLLQSSRTNVVTKNLAEFALTLNPKQEQVRGLLGRFFKRA
jgi:pilus assembly protein CpaE